MKIALFVLSVLLLASARSLAESPESRAPDKSGYTLFNPVPDGLLRDLDTDRPDKSNSPHTLDAGRYQIETGLFTFTRTTASGIRTENDSWADTTLRIGLVPWAELQLEVPIYQTNRDTQLATRQTRRVSGCGDLSVILKTNFWGNDAGDTAGGMGFGVKTPTAGHQLGNGKVEGGAAFLLGLKLPGDFDLGINNGVGIRANDDECYHAEIINSISLSHEIAGPFSGYIEFFSSVPTRHSGDWEGTVDVGCLLMIGKNYQVDAGINIGVTRGADDCQPLLGFSCRF
ncbi:MAG: transporter [Verrucomicrobia bacterium]|nr:transporter [Verrucomicrobiota bacterium]